MKCANCNNELAPITYEGGVVVDACDQCSGMYLDSGELEKIQDNKDNDYSDMLACHPPLLERTFEMARQKHLPDKTCPKCKGASHTGCIDHTFDPRDKRRWDGTGCPHCD